MKKISYLFVIALFLSSCYKEESSYTKTYFINKSDYSVRVVPYSKGSIDERGSRSLNLAERKLVFDVNNRGKGAGYSYASGYLVGMDSAKVIFDERVESIHYKRQIVGTSQNSVKYENPRNIFNPKNYTRIIIDESKHHIRSEYLFEFTAQDYLNAK